jgi:hypothetical protein
MTPDQSIVAYLFSLTLPPICFGLVLGFFMLVRRVKSEIDQFSPSWLR